VTAFLFHTVNRHVDYPLLDFLVHIWRAQFALVMFGYYLYALLHTATTYTHGAIPDFLQPEATIQSDSVFAGNIVWLVSLSHIHYLLVST
jgi:hypothetical protein